MLSGIDIEYYTKKFNIDDITGSTSTKMCKMLYDANLKYKAVRTESLDNIQDYILETIKTHYIIQMVFTPIPHWVIITDIDVNDDLDRCTGDKYVIIYDPSCYIEAMSMSHLETYLDYAPYLGMSLDEFDELGYHKMFIVEK
jgi:hypothetical protein